VFGECGRDGPGEVRLAILLGVEGVEDAERVAIDPEGVSGPGARLGGGQRLCTGEEVRDGLFLPGPGFDEGQHTVFERHRILLCTSARRTAALP